MRGGVLANKTNNKGKEKKSYKYCITYSPKKTSVNETLMLIFQLSDSSRKCLMKAIIYLVRIEVSQALNSGKYVERGFESKSTSF